MEYSNNGMRSQRVPQPHVRQQQSAPYFQPPPREEFPQYSNNSRYPPKSQKQFGQPTRHSDVRKDITCNSHARAHQSQYPPPPVGQYASAQHRAADQTSQQDVASQSLVVSNHPSAHDRHSQLAPYNEHIARSHLPPPPPGPPPRDHEYNRRRHPADRYSRRSDSDDSDEHENTQRHRHKKRSKYSTTTDARHDALGSKGQRFTSEDKGLAASTLGGAGGALLGKSAGGGVVGIVGGLLAGAIGAGKLEDRYERRRMRRRRKEEEEEWRDAKAGKYYSDDGGRRSRRRRADDGYHSDDY
ncbi:hypothetical protein MBLNU457_g0573t1 [Dothideomycetes sp. NU457]